MPDDPMFSGPAPSAIDPNVQIPGDPEVSPGNGEADAGDPVQVQAIQEAVAAVVGPMQSSLQSRIDDLEGMNRDLQSRLETRQTPEPVIDPSNEEFYNEFATDPQGTLKKQIESQLNDGLRQMAPLLQQHNAAAHNAYLAGHQQEIDREFGAGTYRDEFAPILEKRFDQMRQVDPTRLSDPEWLSTEVNGVKGFKFDTLLGRRTSHAEKSEEARTAEVQQMAEHLLNNTALSGGLTPPSSSNTREPTAEEQNYLELQARQGIVRDPADLRTAVTSGNTLAEYRAAKTKAEEKK